MKLFLAGMLLGPGGTMHPDLMEMAEQLRSRHYEIESSHEIIPDSSKEKWEEYVRQNLLVMLTCDGLVLMPRWEIGRMTRLLCLVADKLNMFVFTVDEHFALHVTEYGNQNATEMEF